MFTISLKYQLWTFICSKQNKGVHTLSITLIITTSISMLQVIVRNTLVSGSYNDTKTVHRAPRFSARNCNNIVIDQCSLFTLPFASAL